MAPAKILLKIYNNMLPLTLDASTLVRKEHKTVEVGNKIARCSSENTKQLYCRPLYHRVIPIQIGHTITAEFISKGRSVR